MRLTTRNNGFSLIELLIVVVIIGVIAAISVPNLLAARRSANEASALVATRKIGTAQLMYSSTIGNNNYGTPAQLYAIQLIGKRTAAAANVNVGGYPATNQARDGYRFKVTTTPNSGSVQPTYVVSAIPSTTSGATQTGAKRYCLTENGLLKSSTASLGTNFTYANCGTAAAFGS